MTKKRKRANSASCVLKLHDDGVKAGSSVLTACYPKVLTLREYFLTKLPRSSRVRRQKLEATGDPEQNALLDRCLVGVLTDPGFEIQHERARELVAFTQTQGIASGCHTGRGQSCSINEIVDFVVWLLFKKCPLAATRPRHLLCNGLQRGAALPGPGADSAPVSVLPGIFQQHPNENRDIVRRSPWDQFLSFLGADGEAIFSSLFLDCGLFVKLSQGNDNYLQISGMPVSDLNCSGNPGSAPSLGHSGSLAVPRKLSEVIFVRNRILYAKPSLNKSGHVQFGLRHVHVLQRYTRLDSPEETVHVMKHVFPRQFGLQNVFTSRYDPRETSQRFPEYTYREAELCADAEHPKSWKPRRLRGGGERLVFKLRRRHAHCAYTQLLRHYCPMVCRGTSTVSQTNESHSSRPWNSTALVTQEGLHLPLTFFERSDHAPSARDFSYLAHATPASQVSAFCRSTLRQLLPQDSFGSRADGEHNWQIIFHNIDSFVHMRRFETLGLHEVCSRLRLRCISWLEPPNLQGQAKMSQSDTTKRCEILWEFVYYIFDSLLIPLLRCNFYVTESGAHRNKLFFFRHDVWRKLSEPSLAMLRLSLYRPLKPGQVRHILDSRTLGYSNVRLLPKAEGTRTITNLRRRMSRLLGGKRILGPSINAQLGPVFSAMRCERARNPDQLGGAIFSIGGLHDKLKVFRDRVQRNAKLYFVKVDIHACFDTIPQKQLVEMIAKTMHHAQYRTTRYTELKSSDRVNQSGGGRCKQKFAGLAQPVDEGALLSESTATEIARGKDGIVLMDNGNQRVWQHRQLMGLLQEHVQRNIVKIGKKHFKQAKGIPQGSVLSSLLCSFFYSSFEQAHLDFLQPDSSLLVRLIDDFLLVTDDKQQAQQFLQVMINGNDEYGISVNPEKTLANFEVQLGLQKIPRHHGRGEFPYCGVAIDTRTLEVRKDWQRKDGFVNNSLTVDATRTSGSTFRRKVVLSFKMQMHAMLLDPALNSYGRIVATYMEAWEETAMKMHQYARSMRQHMRPSAKDTCGLITGLVKTAVKLGRKRQSIDAQNGARDSLSKTELFWIASIAFERVIRPKQTEYQQVLRWLRVTRTRCEASRGMKRKLLHRFVEGQDRVLQNAVY